MDTHACVKTRRNFQNGVHEIPARGCDATQILELS